ncbi:MAG: hypothetical protein ABIU87_01775 [Ornithinibacter sp.]
MLGVGPGTSAQAAPAPPPEATGWYLALDDSFAAGYQPGAGDDLTGGYVGVVLDAVKAKTSEDQARQHCVSGTEMAIDGTCPRVGLNDVATLLPAALHQIHAAGPSAKIVVANYDNPFLAADLAGPSGQLIAAQSVVIQTQFNDIIATAATAANPYVADLTTAFRSSDPTLVSLAGVGQVPTNVAAIFAWTWMCTLGDTHANDTGYAALAASVAVASEARFRLPRRRPERTHKLLRELRSSG